MADDARAKRSSVLLTLLGILIGIYLPCTWVLFDPGGRLGPSHLGFAEMPIHLANMVVMLSGRPEPLPRVLLAVLVLAFVTAFTYFGRTNAIRRTVAISLVFLSSCFLSLAVFAMCHGHS
jgi:hypothetical protein